MGGRVTTEANRPGRTHAPTDKNDGRARNPLAAVLVANVGRPFDVLGTVRTPRI
jgi:hypothetical protein